MKNSNRTPWQVPKQPPLIKMEIEEPSDQMTVDEYLEIHKHLKAIEKMEEAKERNFEDMKHSKFYEYLEDVMAIGADVKQRFDNEESEAKARKAIYDDALRQGGIDPEALEILRLEAEVAEKKAKKNIEALRNETDTRINNVRESMYAHVRDFYGTNNPINSNVVALLNSGIELNQEEYEELVSSNRNSPLTVRLIGQNMVKNGFKTGTTYIDASNETEGIMGLFDSLKGDVVASIGDNHATREAHRMHMDSRYTSAREALTNAICTPAEE